MSLVLGHARERRSAMGDHVDLGAFVDGAWVDPVVFELRPDYRVLLVAVSGIAPGASDSMSEDLLVRAEQEADRLLVDVPVEELPHIGAWREAYRVFGAKPQRTRNSLEALTRRAGIGLPRVNRLTDVYNALSVLHQVPIGGEDLMRYAGSPQLARATGDELFDTAAGGEPVLEHPDAGEVVWRDDDGVTCRRWNWRQCRRTQLAPDTTAAVFILDALAPMTNDALTAAADDLVANVRRLGDDVRVATRLIAR